MTTFITQILGKTTQDGHWIVPAMDEDIRPGLLRREDYVAHVRVRKDLNSATLATRSLLDARIREALAGQPITVAVGREYDPGSRTDIVQVKRIPSDQVVPLTARLARICLNPEKYGLLFEECFPDGSVPEEWRIPDGPTNIRVLDEPELVGGGDADLSRRLLEQSKEIEELKAQLARAAELAHGQQEPPRKRHKE